MSRKLYDKVKALYDNPGTEGEKIAAKAALDRILESNPELRIIVTPEPPKPFETIKPKPSNPSWNAPREHIKPNYRIWEYGMDAVDSGFVPKINPYVDWNQGWPSQQSNSYKSVPVMAIQPLSEQEIKAYKNPYRHYETKDNLTEDEIQSYLDYIKVSSKNFYNK